MCVCMCVVVMTTCEYNVTHEACVSRAMDCYGQNFSNDATVYFLHSQSPMHCRHASFAMESKSAAIYYPNHAC